MSDSIESQFGRKVRIRVCGVLVENNKILLVEHKGFGPLGSLFIPPGGGLEYGETTEACLEREYLEETGLKVKTEEFLFAHEFIKAPLHAMELFFRVSRISGDLKLGSDPEMPTDKQVIASIGFYSASDLSEVNPELLHNMLQKEPDPVKFEHLRGFFKFVVNS